MGRNTLTLALPLICSCLVPNPAVVGNDDATDTTEGHETDAGDPEEEGSSGSSANENSDTGSTSDPDETSGSPTDTSGGPSCTAPGLQCVPAVPAGWNGPVTRLDDDDPDIDSCGGAYPDSVAGGATDIVAPAPDCDCSCAAPSGGACSPSIDVRLYDVTCGTTCNVNYGSCANVTTTLADLGSGTFLDDDWNGIRLWPDAPQVTANPTCEPVSNHVIPELQLSHVELCAPAAALEETCEGDDVCVATPDEPFAATSCIWTEGATQCPAGDYVERDIIYRSVDDTRSCSECSCGGAQNVACEGQIAVSRSWPNHFELPTMYPADGNCSDRIAPSGIVILGDVTFAIAYDPPDPTASGCPASGGEASGIAAGSQPITLCCLAP